MLSFILPKITVTPASDDLVSSKFDHPSAAPAHARRHSVITLTLPPLAHAHDDRMSVAQSGLRLGSFRLNCAESVAVAVNLPGLNADNSSPKANLASTKRVFNWGSSNALQGSQKSTHAAGRHSRAKSLNSLADFTLPAHVKAPTELGSSRRSKYRSGSSVLDIGRNGYGTIDLSILDSPSMQSSISDSTLFTSPKRDAFGFSFPRSR